MKSARWRVITQFARAQRCIPGKAACELHQPLVRVARQHAMSGLPPREGRAELTQRFDVFVERAVGRGALKAETPKHQQCLAVLQRDPRHAGRKPVLRLPSSSYHRILDRYALGAEAQALNAARRRINGLSRATAFAPGHF